MSNCAALDMYCNILFQKTNCPIQRHKEKHKETQIFLELTRIYKILGWFISTNLLPHQDCDFIINRAKWLYLASPVPRPNTWTWVKTPGISSVSWNLGDLRRKAVQELCVLYSTRICTLTLAHNSHTKGVCGCSVHLVSVYMTYFQLHECTSGAACTVLCQSQKLHRETGVNKMGWGRGGQDHGVLSRGGGNRG